VAFNAREFFGSFIAAVNARDKEHMRSLVHPDFVSHIRQSGEQSRGFEAFWAQLEGYPGGGPEIAEAAATKLIGGEERWAITPAYTVVPLAAGGKFTTITRSRYPDGSSWWVVSLVELRDGKLHRFENYFAPELPAPLGESIASWSRG
jgi:hypothetical protein